MFGLITLWCFGPIFELLYFYSVDRTIALDERIEILADQWSGLSQNRLAEGLPPIPSDVPEYIIRPPLPTGPAPDHMEGGATPTLDEMTSSAQSKFI